MKQKEQQIIVTAVSPSAPGTVICPTQFKSGWLSSADVFTVDGIFLGATGGTLDIILQRKIAVNTWSDWAAFGQLTAGQTQFYSVFSMDGAGTWSVAGLGGGTDVTSTSSLAAGAFVNCLPGAEVRIVFKAGAGTIAGASQTIIITPYTNKT